MAGAGVIQRLIERFYSQMGLMIGWIGRKFLEAIELFLDFCALPVATLGGAWRLTWSQWSIIRRYFLVQVYFTGVQAFFLVCIMGLLIGGIFAIEGHNGLEKFGSQRALGEMMIFVLVREICPLLTALIVILRSGSAVTIELGYMSALGEIESIVMMGIDPVQLLGIPRLLGMSLSVICLSIFHTSVSLLGGALIAWTIGGVSLYSLLVELLLTVTGTDFIVLLAKALTFGVSLSVVCLYFGFRTGSEITRVPVQTSKALVLSMAVCLFWNVFFSFLLYV
jgi:phospholipid/cholesterol/gamma-HCH transport system permease protein